MSAGGVSVRRARWRGTGALAEREVVRVLRLWTQTIAPQIVAAVLFIVVFGVALGTQIREVGGVPYEAFIVPGLTLMGIGTAAFANTSSSLYQARSDGFIEDPASSPMGPGQLMLAYLVGGVVRGLLIGLGTLLVARLIVEFPFENALYALTAFTAAAVAFSALGVIVGLCAQGWDQQAFVANLVIQPLVFLGGVFYSVESLPEPWRSLSYADPILYMVTAARHGVLGTSEVDAVLALGVSLALAAALWTAAWALVRRGTGIRT
jgi:ABC-2 type transport system permease protein